MALVSCTGMPENTDSAGVAAAKPSICGTSATNCEWGQNGFDAIPITAVGKTKFYFKYSLNPTNTALCNEYMAWTTPLSMIFNLVVCDSPTAGGSITKSFPLSATSGTTATIPYSDYSSLFTGTCTDCPASALTL